MKKKFKVSDFLNVFLEGERAAGGRAGSKSWHTNQSGFIPPSGRAELSDARAEKESV